MRHTDPSENLAYDAERLKEAAERILDALAEGEPIDSSDLDDAEGALLDLREKA